jgi:hypothetical protein
VPRVVSAAHGRGDVAKLKDRKGPLAKGQLLLNASAEGGLLRHKVRERAENESNQIFLATSDSDNTKKSVFTNAFAPQVTRASWSDSSACATLALASLMERHFADGATAVVIDFFFFFFFFFW